MTLKRRFTKLPLTGESFKFKELISNSVASAFDIEGGVASVNQIFPLNES